MPVDFYKLLGVERDAETAEIKQAFRQRAREYHPDVNDDERATAQFTVVRKAYEVLTDDAERADYDRMGHGAYVEKRLDGLTKFKYPGKASENAGRGESDTGGRSASGRSSAERSASGRSSTGRSASSSSSSSRSSSQRASSSRRSSSASSSSRSSRSRASGSSRTASASQSSAAGGSSRGRTRTSESGRSGRTGTTGRFERGRDGSESSAATASPSGATNPLWYGWSVSVVALVAYLGGFAWHLAGDGAGFAAALASLDTAAPAAGLLASSPLSLPSLAALQAAATPAVLSLPVAATLLAVSLAGVISRFGHAWTTWVYALAAGVPLALVAAGAVGVGRPVAVDLLGFVVCPLLGAGGFVVDAGWYLFASR